MYALLTEYGVHIEIAMHNRIWRMPDLVRIIEGRFSTKIKDCKFRRGNIYIFQLLPLILYLNEAYKRSSVPRSISV
jgi:hypothetical protein